MKNLYLLSTEGLGDFYIVANDPTEAETFLVKTLNEQDYGLSSYRRVINIKWLAETPGPSLKDENKPFLSNKSKRLFITENWK